MPLLTDKSALSGAEFDRLEAFLASAGPSAMNLETLDGFITALISLPTMVMPSQYLPQIWGEDHEFDSSEQAQDIVGLIMRHWNGVADELQLGLKDPGHIHLPVLMQDDDGVIRANDWAHGYMRGAQFNRDDWAALLDDPDHGGLAIPIQLFHYEHHPDPEMRPPPIVPEKREEFVQMLIASANKIYRHFEPHRRAGAGLGIAQPVRRAGPKVGRNDPCPCGSGKKYKHCCGSSRTM